MNSLVFLLLLISSFIPLWLLKNTWFGFNIIRFAQVCFVTSHMIYTGECSISAREGGICCYRWVGCSASAKCIYSTAQLTSNVSSLIFCVGEPSNVESGVLNSTATIIYSSLPLFRTVSIHSIYLGAPYVGCIYIYSCYTHRMNWLFITIQWLSLPTVTVFGLKSILSDVSIATLAFFWFVFCRKYIFLSLHFQSVCGLEAEVTFS